MSVTGPDVPAYGVIRPAGRVLIDYFNSFTVSPTTEGLTYEIDRPRR